MAYTVAEIAAAIGAEYQGDGSLTLTGAAEPAEAGSADLALAMAPKYADAIKAGRADVAMLWPEAEWQALGLKAAIFVSQGKLAMAGLTGLLDPGPSLPARIHPTAWVSPDAEIDEDCRIGAFAVIEAGVKIGARGRICSHATVASGAQIGTDVLLHPGTRVTGAATLGDRVILHPNAVVGADGFSFVTPEPSSVERIRGGLSDENTAPPMAWQRVHSLGRVILEDDVELGANSNVDRGTIRATIIGRGTKIDNLVQIGHNVIVGEDCMICSQVGIAGSAKIGHRVVLAGKVGVNDNISVGDDVVAGGAARLFTNVPAGRVVLGNPATKMSTQLQIQKAMRRLPRLFRDVAALQKAVSKSDQSD